MASLHTEIRRGAYHDSIVLMQLQSALAELPGVEDAGVVMGTQANLELLVASGLPPQADPPPAGDDLVIVIRAEDEESGQGALGEIDRLFTRRSSNVDSEFRPRSLASALKLAPDAEWVLVSVPGGYAAAVAHEALDGGRNVFLYSDNLQIEEEVELKQRAAELGLLVMGPDCGTAIVGGFGLGFANRVTPGSIGLVGASGTGLQAITAAIDAQGGGISHVLGTGGRDLSEAVAGATALAALERLAQDDATEVIVLVSKPPAPEVTKSLLSAAARAGKPVVVCFIGYVPPGRQRGNLHFAVGLEDAARLAIEIGATIPSSTSPKAKQSLSPVGDLRALFAGGTLCYEAQQALRWALSPLRSNAPILDTEPISGEEPSEGHTLLDLGADEFTVGRPHPMIHQELRIRRLRQEAADPSCGVLLLDVVLGDGAHPDPADELAPAISEILAERDLPVVVMIVGTEKDPQSLDKQRETLEAAGAIVFQEVDRALDEVLSLLTDGIEGAKPRPDGRDHSALSPRGAINVGLEIFSAALVDQGLSTVHVDWQPPAGGNEALAAILARMR